jgi:hypothetical protein
MIANYLDCSTGMLSHETYVQLTGHLIMGEWPAMTVAPYEFGVFISVPPASHIYEHADGLPEDLFCLLIYADEHDCQVIRLDAEGDRLDDLHFHEW